MELPVCLDSRVISLPETSPTSLHRMDFEAHDYDIMEDLKANRLFRQFFPPPHQFCSVAILCWLKRRFTESWLTSTVQLCASGAPQLRFTIQGTDESRIHRVTTVYFSLASRVGESLPYLASLHVIYVIHFIWLQLGSFISSSFVHD